MQNANRNEWVDYAKGFGIVLVVYGHILTCSPLISTPRC